MGVSDFIVQLAKGKVSQRGGGGASGHYVKVLSAQHLRNTGAYSLTYVM
jgi:hypothetical protein